MLKVCVASTNKAKVKAVEEVFTHYFNKAKVIPVKVDPGVATMPKDEEIIIGGLNRVKRAKEMVNADYYVGIESGIMKFPKVGYMVGGFVVVIDKEGKIGCGFTGWFKLSDEIMARIEKGEELASIMAEITGDRDVRSKQGAVGFLTQGYVTRKELIKQAVAFALSSLLKF